MQFPILELEPEVQIGDKTRFNASKTFVSKGSLALSTMTLTPGVGETPINIFSLNQPNNWFADWAFTEWKIDIDAMNNKIDFKEASVELTATLTSGSYTFSQLLTQIATQMTAAGSQVYSVTANNNDEITISAPAGFVLLLISGSNRNSSILSHIGFEESSSSQTSVTGDRVEYLTRKISLTVGDGVTTTTLNKYIDVYSVEGDRLFSSDADLVAHEPDILQWIVAGRASYLDFHRRAQRLIFAWLDKNGYVDIFDEKYDKFDVQDKEELRMWSTHLCLKIIFESFKNASDDVFQQKREYYSKEEQFYRNRLVLRIDADGNGKVEDTEFLTISSGNLIRQ